MYLYSMKNICIQSKIFIFNKKYFCCNTQRTLLLIKGYQKSYSRYLLSFNNVQLTAQWFKIRNLVCILDQYPGYDDGIWISWSCVCNITLNNLIFRTSSFYFGNQNFDVLK